MHKAKADKMDPPCWAQFLQVVLFIHPWSELPPFLIASIMSNEREWIEHTLSHAHHETRVAPPISTPGLLCDSQQCRGTTGDPRSSHSPRSLAQPFLFSLPHSLSLPSPFAHCHSANDDGRRGVGGGRGGGGGGHHKGHFAHGTFNACAPRVWAVCHRTLGAPLSVREEVA